MYEQKNKKKFVHRSLSWVRQFFARLRIGEFDIREISAPPKTSKDFFSIQSQALSLKNIFDFLS
jgi:hypothetical protein